jgi:hypothetical protein
MVAPLTPKPKRKAEALTKAPPTIASRLEEDTALKKWSKPRLCCANGTAPKTHTHPSHERDGQAHNTGALTAPPTPKPKNRIETPLLGWSWNWNT